MTEDDDIREPRDLGPDRSLLVLDDDEPFRRRLARAMERRGFEVTMAESVADEISEFMEMATSPVRNLLQDKGAIEVRRVRAMSSQPT